MTTEQQQVLYVHDLAKLLGRTESALRTGIQRGADWVPPRLNTRRLCWSRDTVVGFLKGMERKPANAGGKATK